MKRDMDLIRTLMLRIEALDLPPGAQAIISGDEDEIRVEGYSRDEVAHHLHMLLDAGFIIGKALISDFQISRISPAGHDFLDTTRDSTVWKMTKEGAKKMGGVGLDLLLSMGKAYAKHVAETRLGLKLG